MPATSQAQYKFMMSVALGNVKQKGLTPKKAKEFLQHVDYQKLPKKVKK